MIAKPLGWALRTAIEPRRDFLSGLRRRFFLETQLSSQRCPMSEEFSNDPVRIGPAARESGRSQEVAVLEKSYDEVPYPGGAHRVTHPSHIAMVAKLFGTATADPQNCRVLELGCSIGSNLLPMAESLPGSQFTGIDLSLAQIEQGKQLVAASGLTNVELHALDVTDLDASFGDFDYILCHGVYSWVPPVVQEAIIDIGKRHLKPNGVQLVSYNTYPGWNLRNVVRDMMLYHTEGFDDPKQKIGQSRALLKFLAKSTKGSYESYMTLIQEEAKKLDKHGDYYLYHEHLEAQNHPVYFHDFVRRVDAGGLRYLADTSVRSMVAQLFDEEAAEILRGVPLLRREQYMDFLSGRMFRSSLICHQDIRPDYRAPSRNLRDLHIRLRAPLRINEEAEVGTIGEVVWEHPRGKLTTSEPITSVFRKLNEHRLVWTAIADLLDEVTRESNMLDVLMASFVQGITVLAQSPPALCAEIVERPRCSEVARMQAKRGSKVTNRVHDDVILQPQQRLLVAEMDGQRTKDVLAEILCRAVEGRRLKVTRGGDDGNLPDLSQDLGRRIVDTEIERLRNLNFLVA